MSSITEEMSARRRHELFFETPEFTSELACIPYKWRKRVMNHAFEKMAWSSWHRIYEPIAIDFVRDFSKQYVPSGIDMSQDDNDIIETAKKAAKYVSNGLCAARSNQHVLLIIQAICKEYGITAPQF